MNKKPDKYIMLVGDLNYSVTERGKQDFCERNSRLDTSESFDENINIMIRNNGFNQYRL